MSTVIDLHVHTTKGSKDSKLSPYTMVEEAKRLGIEGICITEHDEPWDSGEFNNFAKKHDLLLIRGVEVDTDMGHVLVFGLDTYVSGIDRMDELKKIVDRNDGFMITAHPFRGLNESRPIYLYPDGMNIPKTVGDGAKHKVFDLVDAVEVANGGTVESENRFALKVAQQLGRYKTGGSDAHSVNGLGRCVTVFQDQICSEKAFIDALKSGRYYPAVGLKGQKLTEYK